MRSGRARQRLSTRVPRLLSRVTFADHGRAPTGWGAVRPHHHRGFTVVRSALCRHTAAREFDHEPERLDGGRTLAQPNAANSLSCSMRRKAIWVFGLLVFVGSMIGRAEGVFSHSAGAAFWNMLQVNNH